MHDGQKVPLAAIDRQKLNHQLCRQRRAIGVAFLFLPVIEGPRLRLHGFNAVVVECIFSADAFHHEVWFVVALLVVSFGQLCGDCS